MDFEKQYLTYDEYYELGGSLEEEDFNLLEYDVRMTIDERTQGRLTTIDEIPEQVKMCVFKMLGIEQSYQDYETADKTIASESIDGYSVSYRQADKSVIEAKNDELEREMRKYFSNVIVDGVPILYLGVDK